MTEEPSSTKRCLSQYGELWPLYTATPVILQLSFCHDAVKKCTEIRRKHLNLANIILFMHIKL